MTDPISGQTDNTVETLLAFPDPYFISEGVPYSFLPSGGDCGLDTHCYVSDTPIQAAIDMAKDFMLESNTIYIEGGVYMEDITIDGFSYDINLTGGALSLSGLPTGSTTLIGSILISNTKNTITLIICFLARRQLIDSQCAKCGNKRHKRERYYSRSLIRR